MANEQGTSTAPRPAWIVAGTLLLLAMTVAAYLPAIRDGGFIWDDDAYVTANPTLRSLPGLGDIWSRPGATPQYYPLVHTTFWMEYHLWELAPLGYHAVNVALHALAAVAVLFLLRRRIGRGPVAAALVFVLTLFPALGFVNVYPFRYSFVADHFQYHAMAALVALGAALAALAVRRLGDLGRLAGLAAAGVLLAALGYLTWQQCHIYKDAETLWRATLVKNPDCPLAHNNIGHILDMQGKHAEALAEFETAVRLNPQYATARANLVTAHTNVAGVLYTRGQWDEAIAHCHEALRLDSKDACAHNALGMALAGKGRLSEVMDHYREALRLDPQYAPAYNELGLALAASGRTEEAIVQYREALRRDPQSPTTYGNLGIALVKTGKTDEAVACFSQMVRLRPDDVQARLSLAALFIRLGRVGDGMAQYRAILRRAPDSAPALAALAWLRATAADPSMRHGADAVRLAERATQVTGGKDFTALDALAAAYAEVGRFADAAGAARQAVAAARAQNRGQFAAQIEARLRLYEAGKPYHTGP